MKRTLTLLAAALLTGVTSPVLGFCGFYVARADTKLFNQASQVALVRDGPRTVLTMSNDFQGDVDDFAMVIPVPMVLEREQIHVTERGLIDHLDAYTAPRLVEYFDADPCQVAEMRRSRRALAESMVSAAPAMADARAKSLGVTIEASYTVGEYDILILSALESSGLVTWLTENDYRVPAGAEPVVKSYLARGMKFFVAKVNLKAQSKLGYAYLRPLQVAYESPRFMLPIRLGMVNANGPQELFIYTLTRKGRVETTNYPTVRLPTGHEIPTYVKGEFGDFYKAMFSEQARREKDRAVFLEYAWDMGWCDPCAADPLSGEQLRELGVYWLEATNGANAPAPRQQSMPRPRPQAVNVFVTRLHVRYDAQHFPEDLMFQETADRKNFQGRYVIRHPFKGEATCEAGERYFSEVLPERREREISQLATLTGWDTARIRARLETEFPLPKPSQDTRWWRKLWDQDR